MPKRKINLGWVLSKTYNLQSMRFLLSVLLISNLWFSQSCKTVTEEEPTVSSSSKKSLEETQQEVEVEKPQTIIVPTGSLGNISEVKKKMLEKTLESALDDHFAIVPKDLFEEAQEKAFEELDYEECTEEQCIMMIKEILQVENAFQLVLMEEDGDTQISLTWNDLDQKRVETDYCEGCKTKELIKSIGRLVDKLVGVKKVASKKLESKVVLQTKSKISSVSKLEESETECTSVCDGLVAYYPFNGDAIDKSGNGKDAKVFGASLAKDRNGYQNHAYSFDGVDDYVQFEKFQFSESSFSISIIGKFNKISDDWHEKKGWSRGALAHSHEKSSFWFGYIFRKNGSNNINFSIREKSDTWAEVESSKIDPLEYNLYTGVADKNNNTVRLYVNGQFLGEDTWDGSVYSSSSKWYLGMVGSPNFSKEHRTHLDGLIDEVRTYNRALTAEEVKQLFIFYSKVKKENLLHSSKVVLDPSTGLMWQKKPDPLRVSWENAIKHCDNLVFADRSDWFLPNKSDSEKLINNEEILHNSKTELSYWTATKFEGTYGDGRRYTAAHVVNHYYNKILGPELGTKLNVRCARSSQ